MSDDTLLFWGAIVTLFLGFAFLLTIRQIIENRLAEREQRQQMEKDVRKVSESNSGL